MKTQRGLSMTCKLATLTALAMGPACGGDMGESSRRNPLIEDDDAPAGRPPTPITGMTTYDRASAVPGFSVEISLGGVTGEDVVLDWYGTGFTGDVTIYRSADPVALRDLTLGDPLPAGVTATSVSGVTSYADAGAASRTVQTPHYYYRVALAGGEGGGGNGGNGSAAYVRASDYPPWGHSSNEQAMDMTFGAGSWDDLRYDTVGADELLSSQYSFIFMEGGDSNANELEVFVADNIVAIEQWVDSGGTLFLNAAPNEGGSQAWGFGGVTLNYPDFPTDPGHAVDASHPIWAGPHAPTATSFTGNSYAHATVSGPGLVSHILDADGGNPNLAELDWGAGHVMFGGLTTSDWWSPTPEAINLRANIIGYLADGATSGPQLSTMVMKTTTVTAAGYNRFGLCMLDGPATASEAYAQFGGAAVGVHQWDADTQSYMSWTPGGGQPDFPLLYGSAVVAQLDGSAESYLSLVGVVPTDEALAVSGEPGYNWATLPVFYDGPTSTDYWITTAGYWGVGVRHNDTQTEQYDWNDPGYDPFEMEPCGAYDMYLPSNACAGNDDCGEGTFCYFVEPAACGAVAAGLCMPEPLGCEGAPESQVCGCDGQTYANQCEAEASGTSVRGDGPCPAQPATCGDGNLDEGEQCDGENVGEASCESEGFGGGTLGCTAECTLDTDGCMPAGGGGGGGEVCELGIDPFTGNEWVVCAADGDTAWVSHSNAGGGNFHADFICQSLGYEGVGQIGGTCGNVCGYCEGETSCEATGNQYFDGGGDCGADENGQILCYTVMWECTNGGGGGGGAVCGDGNVDYGEQCDGGNLGEASCGSLGFVGGELGCTADCTYDTAACTNGGGGDACEGGVDAVAAALAACQDQYPNCDIMDGGVVGYGDDVGPGSNCGTPDHQWRFYCTETSDDSNYNCSACTVGEILGAHDPCSCAPDTSPVLGSFCEPAAPGGGGGGTGEACEGGVDPITGDDWVVCAADANEAWVSHGEGGGGNYHPEQICASLGYESVGAIGGTCGNVCGYCEGTTSCTEPGTQTFDGGGDCGADEGGQILCYTVQWQCLNALGGV